MASQQKPLPKTPASKAPPASRKKIGTKPAATKPARPVRPAARSRAPPPHLKHVKSLPQDFRFAAGSPLPADNSVSNSNDNDNSIDQMAEEEEEEVIRSSNNLNLDAGEEDAVAVNDDSPYSCDKSNDSVQIEKKPEEEIAPESAMAASSRLPEDLPSRVESRWSDTNSYAAKKKLHGWCQLPNGDWALGKIISTSGQECIISLPEGKVMTLKTECLLPANPDILDGVDDLMQLSYLNEPSVLYNLQYRYSQDMIYTKAGPVLVAINPFKKVPLYGNDYIEAYRRKSMTSPHVYAIADTAIREMIRDEVNQSIIIRT